MKLNGSPTSTSHRRAGERSFTCSATKWQLNGTEELMSASYWWSRASSSTRALAEKYHTAV